MIINKKLNIVIVLILIISLVVSAISLYILHYQSKDTTSKDNESYVCGNSIDVYKRAELLSSSRFDSTLVNKGEILFESQCAHCHSLNVEMIGPKLNGITDSRDSTWILNFILDSQKMINENDSIAIQIFNKYNKVRMNSNDFNQSELEALYEYLKFETELE